MAPVDDAPSVAVAGAGLSGLTAAHRLHRAGWAVTVFEAEGVIGGRVRTHREDGYQVDVGASAYSAAYRPYIDLVRELGIDEAQVSPWVAIPRDGVLHTLNVEKMITGGLRTKLLSPGAKLRAARLGLDVARAKRRGELDYSDMRKAAPLDTETARAYAERALSTELDRYLVDPIVRAMLIADSGKVSKVELFSGVANIFTSSLHTIRGGQGRVCEALAAPLDIRLDTPVVGVTRDGERVAVSAGGTTARFDAAVVATPLPVALDACPQHAAQLAPLHEKLSYTRCLKVAIGTRRRPDTPVFLVQLPSVEDAEVALVFLDHNKCADRAPAGHGLFDACWETDASIAWWDRRDEDIVARTMKTLTRWYPDLAGHVDYHHVTRWERALPLTSRGAYQAIGDLNAALDPHDPIQFAADYLSAAGQNTAVALGNRAAERLVARNQNR